MHNSQQLRLMQLASSALPVGSFTRSQGLEWAVEIGWVKSVDDFSARQIQQMEQNFLPLTYRCWRDCIAPASRTISTQHAAGALTCWPVAKPANCGMKNAVGAAFTRLVTDWESDCSREWRTSLSTANSAAWPRLGVRWKIPLTELALSLGYSWIESAVMAGVKLVPNWTTGGPAFDYCALRSLCAGFSTGADVS